MKKNKFIAICLLVIGLQAGLAEAYELPAVNLGVTSFLDGAPPSGPGFYLMQYVQYYDADKFADKSGHHLNLPSPKGSVCPKLDAWMSFTELLYLSNQKLLWGGKWGLVVIVPFVGLDLDGKSNDIIRDTNSGVGDILAGPVLQWDPVMRGGRPFFVHRFVPALLLPTGEYDEDTEINAGSNFISFNPYWAATLFLTPRFTLSWRVHYLWNAENNDPNTSLYPGADDIRAGQAIHVNFTTGYSFIPHKLHVGLNGYYLKQLTDTEINGRHVSGTREQVFAIGPGAVYSLSRKTHLFVNIYFESNAENRTEGNRVNVRFVRHF